MTKWVQGLAEDKHLSKARMSMLLGIDRGRLYRPLRSETKASRDHKVKEALYKIGEQVGVYGYRRMTKELLREHSLNVSPKKVRRIMKENNLLLKRRKKSVITTTDSRHTHPTAPNLARYMDVTDINQLWVSDITYIHFRHGVGYLALVMDAHSRKCLGWAFETHMREELTLSALDMAIKQRTLRPSQERIGLVHHSDRGVQYAAAEYRKRLMDFGISCSMSRKGNCYDNAKAESFNKTIKYEEVYLHEYSNFAEAKTSLKLFLERVYNRKRLHSSLGYCPPDEFEANLCIAQRAVS
jgi:putative transposase